MELNPHLDSNHTVRPAQVLLVLFWLVILGFIYMNSLPLRSRYRTHLPAGPRDSNAVTMHVSPVTCARRPVLSSQSIPINKLLVPRHTQQLAMCRHYCLGPEIPTSALPVPAVRVPGSPPRGRRLPCIGFSFGSCTTMHATHTSSAEHSARTTTSPSTLV